MKARGYAGRSSRTRSTRDRMNANPSLSMGSLRRCPSRRVRTPGSRRSRTTARRRPPRTRRATSPRQPEARRRGAQATHQCHESDVKDGTRTSGSRNGHAPGDRTRPHDAWKRNDGTAAARFLLASQERGVHIRLVTIHGRHRALPSEENERCPHRMSAFCSAVEKLQRQHSVDPGCRDSGKVRPPLGPPLPLHLPLAISSASRHRSRNNSRPRLGAPSLHQQLKRQCRLPGHQAP
jgi:hypothetical protein